MENMNKKMIILSFILSLGIILIYSSFILADNESENNGAGSSSINGSINSNNDENETEIEGHGIIKHLNIEGGCWVILVEDGKGYEPIDLRTEFKKDGLRVEFEGRLRTDMASTCQVGKLIELSKIELKRNFELKEKVNLSEFERARIIKAEHRLRMESESLPENCERGGLAIKCWFENGSRILTIHAGSSGNVIVQVKDVNASTKVTLYKNNDEIYGVFKNNETKRIILPDEAMERIKEKIRAHLENETLNLTEDGKYLVEVKKKARLFFLFKTWEDIRSEIDAETGEIIRMKGPWWEFLARDTPEESEDN